MKRRFSKMARYRGFALVITLAALVFVTVIVLAFFSRAQLNRQITFSSTNLAKSDYLARMSLDFITGELRQEIRDGSTALDGGHPNYRVIYEPRPGSNAWPAKAGVTNADSIGAKTIVKVSGSNLSLRPSGTITASSISITSSSANGRTLSTNRWFGSGGPGLGTQSGAPTWFFVTRDNGIKTPQVADARNHASSDYVVGRFACTVYDTSGLLNANVAGYPSAASSNAISKSSTAYADLSNLDSSFTTNSVKNFVTWRNGSADTATATNYDNYLWNFAAPRGFSQAKEGQNAFLSRKDMLNAVSGGYLNTNVTPYLAHFSRAYTAPSWGPMLNATETTNFVASSGASPIAYKDIADDSASTNRFVPNVRFPAPATITRYADDGTATTYSVRAGDPLMQHRFSLAKLAWLTPDGSLPAGVTAAAVRACFGLHWNNAMWRWDYVGPTGNTPQPSIETLATVAGESREPNFFELLKAGVLSGSVGRDPGPGIDTTTGQQGSGVYASQFDSYKKVPDLQILAIGANIIDQSDRDSYPTAVFLHAWDNSSHPIDDLAINTVYGQENLPYLSGMFSLALADPMPPGGGANGVLKSWLQPQLWNPYQAPSSGVTLTGYPTEFRAYAYGKIYVMWFESSGTMHYGPMTQYDDGTGVVGSPGQKGEIYFVSPGDVTSPFYNNPRALTLDLATTTGTPIVSGTTPKDNCFDASKWSNLPSDKGSVNKFVGFSLSEDPDYNPDPMKTVLKDFLPDSTIPVYFSLQYKGTDDKYHPYNFMARVAQDLVNRAKHMKPSPEVKIATVTAYNTTVEGETIQDGWGPTRPDPRTDRFSESTQWWQSQNTRPRKETMNPQPNVYNIPGGSGQAGGYSLPYSMAFTFVPAYEPTAASVVGGVTSLWSNNDMTYSVTDNGISKNAYYADPDGVVRYGDCYRLNTTTGDGCQLYNGAETGGDAPSGRNGQAIVSPVSRISNPGNGSAQARRPVILNRPFRSVGELGFAYRDLPFKTLDFWSPTSADGALLDFFTVNEQSDVVADQISPSSASAPVLQAIFSGAGKNNNDTNFAIYSSTANLQISGTDAKTLATCAGMTNDISVNGPYRNRAELATRFGPVVSGTASGVAFNTLTASQANWGNKAHAEAPVRALANVSNMRTWNVMIDVVAQTGMFPPGAASLDGFVVQGERRYWLHLAIDRITGAIVDQQLEPVYE